MGKATNLAQVARGGVLQVVNVKLATLADFTASGQVLQASITPRSATSKILVTAVAAGEKLAGGTSDYWTTSVRRNTATLANIGDGATFQQPANVRFNQAASILDSPNTTSPVEYDLFISGLSGSPTARFYSEATTITLMEVAA
jgi:hypothetical protein